VKWRVSGDQGRYTGKPVGLFPISNVPVVTFSALIVVANNECDPVSGVGKSEPLNHQLGGFWSRCI